MCPEPYIYRLLLYWYIYVVCLYTWRSLFQQKQVSGTWISKQLHPISFHKIWLTVTVLRKQHSISTHKRQQEPIVCKKPNDYHMHKLATRVEPPINSDHKSHHRKEICCVELKCIYWPWLGIFWLCRPSFTIQSPTGQRLIIASRLQYMWHWGLNFVCF